MLIRLLYASRAVGPQTTAVTSSILEKARSHNKLAEISGILCQGQGLFLQVLEGSREGVNQLYARILFDRRHNDVQLLLLEEISQRRFGRWSMAHINLAEIDKSVQLQPDVFNPFLAPGAVAMAKIEELVSSGHILTDVIR